MEAIAVSNSPWRRVWQYLVQFAVRLLPQKKQAAQDDAGQLAADALNTYGNAILRCAYSYLHNMADAEEILQDTLLKLLTAAPAFESEAHKKAWLLRVAANLSKNRMTTTPCGHPTSWTRRWRQRGGKTCPLCGTR